MNEDLKNLKDIVMGLSQVVAELRQVVKDFMESSLSDDDYMSGEDESEPQTPFKKVTFGAKQGKETNPWEKKWEKKPYSKKQEK